DHSRGIRKRLGLSGIRRARRALGPRQQLSAPLALLRHWLRRRQGTAVAKIDAERPGIGETKRLDRGRQADRAHAQDPVGRGDGWQCVHRGNRGDLAYAIVVHEGPLKGVALYQWFDADAHSSPDPSLHAPTRPHFYLMVSIS